MAINTVLAKIFRRIFGRKIGKFFYFLFWLIIFNYLIRPLILKTNLFLNNIIKVSEEKGKYLQSLIDSNPFSLDFWFDPYVLPFVLVVILAYLLTLIGPIFIILKASDTFKKF